MVRGNLGPGDAERRAAVALDDSRQAIEALWRVDLREQIANASDRDPLSLALAHAAAGQTDEAFEFLEKAWRIREQWLVFLRVDPRFDPLRADPRFEEMARRIGLP